MGMAQVGSARTRFMAGAAIHGAEGPGGTNRPATSGSSTPRDYYCPSFAILSTFFTVISSILHGIYISFPLLLLGIHLKDNIRSRMTLCVHDCFYQSWREIFSSLVRLTTNISHYTLSFCSPSRFRRRADVSMANIQRIPPGTAPLFGACFFIL